MAKIYFGLRPLEGHTGRPLGNKDFVEGLERILGRSIARRAPGRKSKQAAVAQPKLL